MARLVILLSQFQEEERERHRLGEARSGEGEGDGEAREDAAGGVPCQEQGQRGQGPQDRGQEWGPGML